MFKAIAFGLSVGAGIQAWRNWPPDGPVTANAGAVALVVAVVCAYLAGKARGRGQGSATAVAVAEANATASAVNNAAVNVWVSPVAAPAARPVVVAETLPWLDGERAAADPSALLDGADVRDLLEEIGETDGYGVDGRDW